MGNKKKTGRISKKSLAIVGILLSCVIFAAGQYAVPLYASDDAIDATVEVTSLSEESYGTGVMASSRIWLPQRALGEPDGSGAWMFQKGWIAIELEGTIATGKVSIWIAKRGWKSPAFKMYASADGSTWKHIGSGKCTTTSYTQYDFSGAFGEVNYIKVERNSSGRWSIILLDAVRAKGGDAQREKR